MGFYDIPQRCQDNPYFEMWYPCFCDEMGINDALSLSEDEWCEAFEQYVERQNKYGKS